MKVLNVLAAVLVIVGAVNWGLVALAELDLVATVAGLSFGETNGFSRFIYGLVGLAAVYHAIQLSVHRRWSDRPEATTA